MAEEGAIFMTDSSQQRIYCFDNVKFILIVLVVFGHLLRISDFWKNGGEWLHTFIYSIHMPVFIFLSGWFSKFDRKKIIFRMGYTYILMQMIYLLFDHCILAEESYFTMTYQFTTPYWLLWYLLVCIFYYLLIPFIDLTEKRKQVCVVAICFVLSLISGYEAEIGYYLSLGRFFSFLPFFVMGYYMGRSQTHISLSKSKRKDILLICSAIVLFIYFVKFCTIPAEVFYGADSYANISTGVTTKLFIQVIAVFWILFFMKILLPRLNYKIPMVSVIGRNTLSIFILHGFVVRMIGKYIPKENFSLLEVIFVTIVVVLLFGNSLAGKLFYQFFTGWWIERFWNKSDKQKA